MYHIRIKHIYLWCISAFRSLTYIYYVCTCLRVWGCSRWPSSVRLNGLRWCAGALFGRRAYNQVHPSRSYLFPIHPMQQRTVFYIMRHGQSSTSNPSNPGGSQRTYSFYSLFSLHPTFLNSCFIFRSTSTGAKMLHTHAPGGWASECDCAS